MRLGVFGGSFDPIHNAHLFVAESVRVIEGLDRLLFVPTRNQQHRPSSHAGAADRCEMIRLAIAGNPGFALDETDVAPDATGYTADLLPKLQAKYPGAKLTFVIGADSLVNSTWRRFDEVLEALEYFAIAPRPGVGSDALARVIAAVPSALRERVRTLNVPEISESSSLIRSLVAQGRSARYLLPDAVWAYVVERGLYASERA
jgi:nicotinate-nucleotide adenylyltransferase